MNNYLKKLVKNMGGSLIGIGILNEEIIELIDKNDKIIECNLLDCYSKDNDEIGKIKKISIKKLRKIFKKHRTDSIICNLENVTEFKEKFVYDSIYIGKNKVFIFTSKQNDEILRRYKRFCNINIIKCDDGYIYEITITKKINRINEFSNKLIDNILDFIDIISNLLSDS